MLHVLAADYLDNFRVRLKFNDGEEGVVDLAGKLSGTIFDSLNDQGVFRRFEIIGHTLSWSNGADFAPEYLRNLLAEQNPDVSTATSPSHSGPTA